MVGKLFESWHDTENRRQLPSQKQRESQSLDKRRNIALINCRKYNRYSIPFIDCKIIFLHNHILDREHIISHSNSLTKIHVMQKWEHLWNNKFACLYTKTPTATLWVWVCAGIAILFMIHVSTCASHNIFSRLILIILDIYEKISYVFHGWWELELE